MSGCGQKPSDPTSPERQLLDKSIRAMWGEKRATDVTSLHTVSSVKQADSTFDLETFTRVPDCYRMDRQSFGIKEVQAVCGQKAWASVDTTVIPLTPAEEAELLFHPWLYAISTLEGLKDSERFDLKVLDAVVVGGQRLEQLRVRSKKEHTNLSLLLGIDATTHLIGRVELTDESSDQKMALTMSDYRAVEGVQFAHKIVSERNGKAFATETMREVRLNRKFDDGFFLCPVDLNRDRIVTKEKSLSGVMACLSYDGLPENFNEHTEDLKDWIVENGLEITGPLALIREDVPAAETRPAREQLTIAIPVENPPAEKKLVERLGHSLRTLAARKTLVMTCVGDVSVPQLILQLRQRAEADKLKPLGMVLEVHFSIEKKTRQIQLPVE